jgi:hypothetical protein
VDTQAFGRYHADHSRLTGYVVALPMILELLSSLAIVANRPTGTSSGLAWLGLGLALSSWVVTVVWSVPAHGRLAQGFDTRVHHQLVASNLARLLSWTAHSTVVLVMTARALA